MEQDQSSENFSKAEYELIAFKYYIKKITASENLSSCNFWLQF